MIKAQGEWLKKKISEIITLIWIKEKIRADWSKVLICQIYIQKRNRSLHENYDLLFLAIAKKVRYTRSTTDQIFALKEILVTCYVYEVEWGVYMDFK